MKTTGIDSLTIQVIPTQQQIDFIVKLRNHFDEYGNESVILASIALQMKMPRESVIKMFRDINSTLHGAKVWETKTDAEMCTQCNRPKNEQCDSCSIKKRIVNNNDPLI